MGTPTRSGPRRDDGESRWDPDSWWTIGEAADVAEVAHRQLADWAREGLLTVRTGWREGVEIRLVRAGDVAALVPDARMNAAASRSGLAERAVFTGPRRSALGAGGAALADAGNGAGSPGLADGEPEAETEDWRLAMEREIERLRDCLDASNAARDALDDELRVAMRSEPAAAARRVPAGGPHRAQEPDVRSGPTRSNTAAVAATFALLTGFLAGRLAAPTNDTAHAAPASAVDAPDDDAPDDAPHAPPEGPLPDGTWSTEVALAAFVRAPAPSETTTAVPSPPRVEDTSEPTLGRFPLHRLPRHWRDVVEAVPAAAGVRACAVGERMRGELDVRRALGPCFGPATADGLAVAGLHRVSGTHCCAQHAFVERVASGVTDPSRTAALLAEAAQAERDGLVPPLLVLRAERAAADFVRDRAGPWVAAGLDGPDAASSAGPKHAWALLGEDEEGIRLELTSWAILAEGEAAQRFRMELEIRGGPDGDVLRDFAWLDGR